MSELDPVRTETCEERAREDGRRVDAVRAADQAMFRAALERHAGEVHPSARRADLQRGMASLDAARAEAAVPRLRQQPASLMEAPSAAAEPTREERARIGAAAAGSVAMGAPSPAEQSSNARTETRGPQQHERAAQSRLRALGCRGVATISPTETRSAPARKSRGELDDDQPEAIAGPATAAPIVGGAAPIVASAPPLGVDPKVVDAIVAWSQISHCGASTVLRVGLQRDVLGGMEMELRRLGPGLVSIKLLGGDHGLHEPHLRKIVEELAQRGVHVTAATIESR